uniref:UDP-glucuronosyltransferase n=1 Tax=Mustela putorius furo TaxID=9669 RepID=M3XRY7_MUSPF
MSMKWISVLLLLQLSCFFSSGSCGKVLVWPTEYSHWINIKTILDELVQRGHEVTVLTSAASIVINPNISSAIKYETFPTSILKDDFKDLVRKMLDMWIYNLPRDTFWTYFSQMQEIMWKFSDCLQKLCEDDIRNFTILMKAEICLYHICVLLLNYKYFETFFNKLFQIPFRKYASIFTMHYSYFLYLLLVVGFFFTYLFSYFYFSTKFYFFIHLRYFLFFINIYFYPQGYLFFPSGRPTTLSELRGKAQIWLIRTYWDIEFPRPLLPNFEFVGGLHCKPAKPLPKEMEEFVQSSGENGIVVFTLGSMITNLPEEKANVIASALAQIPQKVLWRFAGKKPDNLGTNTRLYDWIPQNDLLGHPKTKAFVTHGGTNGIYEAIHHGIPMVGIPLFADQPDNLAHMKAKGAAVSLDFHTLSSTDLLNALRMVINNPSMIRQIKKFSILHR